MGASHGNGKWGSSLRAMQKMHVSSRPQWSKDRGTYVATSTGKQASSRLASMRGADALIELAAGDAAVEAGTRLRAHLLR